MLGSALLQSYTQPCTGTMQVSSYIMFADIMLDKESHDPVHLLGSQSCIAKACARGLGSEWFSFSVCSSTSEQTQLKKSSTRIQRVRKAFVGGSMKLLEVWIGFKLEGKGQIYRHKGHWRYRLRPIPYPLWEFTEEGSWKLRVPASTRASADGPWIMNLEFNFCIMWNGWRLF